MHHAAGAAPLVHLLDPASSDGIYPQRTAGNGQLDAELLPSHAPKRDMEFFAMFFQNHGADPIHGAHASGSVRLLLLLPLLLLLLLLLLLPRCCE